VRDEAPILLGVGSVRPAFRGPWLLARHISMLAAQAMSVVIFAAPPNFIAAQLVGTGTSGLVILMVVFLSSTSGHALCFSFI